MRKRIKANSEKKEDGIQRATLNIRLVLLHTRENKWRRAHYAFRSFERFFFSFRRRRRRRRHRCVFFSFAR